MKAIYAGSFDPLTVGHVDLVERASRMVDTLFVGIGINGSKTPMFEATQRFDMATEVLRTLENVSVVTFDGLLVEAAAKFGVDAIVRGLRTYSDFEAEFQMALTNRDLLPRVETIFMIPKHENSYVSSSTVKEVWKYGGDIRRYVPLTVMREMEKLDRPKI